MRQQRTNNSRGQLQLPSRRLNADWFLTLDHIDGVDFYFSLPASAGGYVLNGLPSMEITGATRVPVAAEITGGYYKVSFNAGIEYPCSLRSASLDGCIRQSVGGFYYPFIINLQTSIIPQPLAPLIIPRLDGYSGFTVSFTDDSAGTLIQNTTPLAGYSSNGADSVGFAVVGKVLTLTFAQSQNPGDIVRITSGFGAIWSDSGALWLTGINSILP